MAGSPTTVGAIVPVYGEAPFLAAALDSVLEHDRPPEQVVVVDDGSPTPIALEARHAGRCTLVRREQRGGPAAARNSGLEVLGTDLVALVDSDDLWVEGKLAAQLEAFERHPQAGLCFGRAVIVGVDGEPTGARFAEPPAGPLDRERFGAALFADNPIPTSSVLMRRTALERAGGFRAPDDGLVGGCDWDLWLRLLERDEVLFCEPRARVRYRRHPGGLTADLAVTAEQALAVQGAHPGLVDDDTRRRVEAGSRTLLARARVRQRRYADARAELRRAAALWPPGPRERVLAMLLRVPGARAGLGRRRHYR